MAMPNITDEAAIAKPVPNLLRDESITPRKANSSSTGTITATPRNSIQKFSQPPPFPKTLGSSFAP